LSLANVGVPSFSDVGPVGLALIVAFLILSLGLHEAAHAWVAFKRGDSTAKDIGRMTLNPIPHIDPIMTVLLPVILYSTTGFLFGGARPVPVNAQRLRKPLRDMMLVALAGPLSNLCLAVVFLAAYKVFVKYGLYANAAASIAARQEQLLPLVLGTTVMLNILLFVFNLVPVPPLDGSRVMAWLLPQPLREAYVGLERIGMLLIFFMIFAVPGFRQLLARSMLATYQFAELTTAWIA
jgi:Zn-dependent protease